MLPGRSVFESAEGRPVFHQSLDYRRSLAHRLDSIKVIYHYHNRPTQAYNVITDPFETIDISATLPDHYLSATELQLAVWQRRVIASYPGDRWATDLEADMSAQDGPAP